MDTRTEIFKEISEMLLDNAINHQVNKSSKGEWINLCSPKQWLLYCSYGQIDIFIWDETWKRKISMILSDPRNFDKILENLTKISKELACQQK